MYSMRFDMRAPRSGAPITELYAAAVEMSGWAETRGCLGVVLCEHHGSEDGYLPAPLILASAIAARTHSLPLLLTVILPFYDPVRLAEEMAVLDVISRGRVSYVFGLGYRPGEYEHFGVDKRTRGRVAGTKLGLLRSLLTGDSVVYDGRRIKVTPAPSTPGAPVRCGAGGAWRRRDERAAMGSATWRRPMFLGRGRFTKPLVGSTGMRWE